VLVNYPRRREAARAHAGFGSSSCVTTVFVAMLFALSAPMRAMVVPTCSTMRQRPLSGSLSRSDSGGSGGLVGGVSVMKPI